MKIFLSYASECREQVEAVALALNAEGHDVFFDREGLPAGDTYNDQIHAAIEACDFAVFLISPGSVAKGRYTRSELKFMRTKWPSPGQRVLPVMLEETSYEKIPPYLKTVNVLEAEGNLAAEVAAEVRRIEKQLVTAGTAARKNTISGTSDVKSDASMSLGGKSRMIVAAIACIAIIGLAVLFRAPVSSLFDGPDTVSAKHAFPRTLRPEMDNGNHWKVKRRGDSGESLVTLLAKGATGRALYYIGLGPEAKQRGIVKNMQFFTGRKVGATYEGKIWLYSKSCGPVQIEVSGPVTNSADGISITLQGEERVRNKNCEQGELVSRIWDLEYQ